MNIQIQKAKDKPYETIPYVSWLKSYVKNGKAHLYDKINYPDLAKLKQRDSYGFIIKKSIVDLRIAKNIEKMSRKRMLLH